MSPRGALALTAMAKANALYENRDYCIPLDVKKIYKDVVCHRLVLNSKARMNKITSFMVADEILGNEAVPRQAKR